MKYYDEENILKIINPKLESVLNIKVKVILSYF